MPLKAKVIVAYAQYFMPLAAVGGGKPPENRNWEVEYLSSLKYQKSLISPLHPTIHRRLAFVLRFRLYISQDKSLPVPYPHILCHWLHLYSLQLCGCLSVSVCGMPDSHNVNQRHAISLFYLSAKQLTRNPLWDLGSEVLERQWLWQTLRILCVHKQRPGTHTNAKLCVCSAYICGHNSGSNRDIYGVCKDV